MSDKKEPVTLKLTAAVALGGHIHRAGSLVEVGNAEACNLLARGKAVPATDKDAKLAETPEPTEAELAAAAKEAAVKARAMADNNMNEAAFDALSAAKRKALLKQAEEVIAKEAA